MTWSLLRTSFHVARVQVSDGCERVLRERVQATGGAAGAKKHSAVRADYSREEHYRMAAASTSFTRSWSFWLLVGVCLAVSLCIAHLQLLCFFLCGLCFHQITSTHTALPALPLVSRKKETSWCWNGLICSIVHRY